MGTMISWGMSIRTKDKNLVFDAILSTGIIFPDKVIDNKYGDTALVWEYFKYNFMYDEFIDILDTEEIDYVINQYGESGDCMFGSDENIEMIYTHTCFDLCDYPDEVKPVPVMTKIKQS